jgi:hypothetical protein
MINATDISAVKNCMLTADLQHAVTISLPAKTLQLHIKLIMHSVIEARHHQKNSGEPP